MWRWKKIIRGIINENDYSPSQRIENEKLVNGIWFGQATYKNKMESNYEDEIQQPTKITFSQPTY